MAFLHFRIGNSPVPRISFVDGYEFIFDGDFMMKSWKHPVWLALIVLVPVILMGYIAFHVHELPQEQERVAARHPVPARTGKTSLRGTGPGRPVSGKRFSQEDDCARVEKRVEEFFRYLDSRSYVRQMGLKNDTYTCFRNILRKLSENSPIPAGEAGEPAIMIRNICYFFRTLSRSERRLILETIANEQGSIESNLKLFYDWLDLEGKCPQPEGSRPSMDVCYKYAGFFVNTTGGRGYLLRRSPILRVLISYYCVLIIHKADKMGKNNYGIDILPCVSLLKREFIRYSDFKNYRQYINQLVTIEKYYLDKRSPAD